ncbi:mRNA splicing protein prp18 [Maudiozyma exigua]|uniref:Pre-mRNA-splicing factor 18 n=1 Tax=Maudiozyma exigua TaxID=34358 RepID=A0A9P7BE32_MAUEX|nr:mRNA splicing protein prp18 [Kazachstania exigua]
MVKLALSDLIKQEIEKNKNKNKNKNKKPDEITDTDDTGGKIDLPTTNRPPTKLIVTNTTKRTHDTTDPERHSKIRKIITAENKDWKKVPFMILPEDITKIEGDNDIRTKLCIQCNRYIHSIIKQWSRSQDTYPVSPSLFLETKQNLFPLLVQLRKRTIASKLLITLSTLLYHLQKNEIELSLQIYLKLSIGDVAWPIGVSDIGIHSRSAQSKISRFNKDDNDIANIMIDEVTRLWIISIKRLISFKSWFITNQKK